MMFVTFDRVAFCFSANDDIFRHRLGMGRRTEASFPKCVRMSIFRERNYISVVCIKKRLMVKLTATRRAMHINNGRYDR